MTEYKTVSLPKDLVKRVDKYVKSNNKEGFTSVPEFIKAVIREKLDKK